MQTGFARACTHADNFSGMHLHASNGSDGNPQQVSDNSSRRPLVAALSWAAHVSAGIALDLTNTDRVGPIVADKDSLPPMPRVLLTTADNKLQIWDLKTEGTCLKSKPPLSHHAWT